VFAFRIDRDKIETMDIWENDKIIKNKQRERQFFHIVFADACKQIIFYK